MKRMLAVVLSLVLCLLMLSGCMSVESLVTIRPEGTGVYTMRSGMTAEGLVMVAMFSGAENEEQAIEVVSTMMAEMEEVKINDVSYYTRTKTENFSTLGELNELLGSSEQGLLFHNNADGTVGLTYLASEDGATQMIGLDEATKKELFESGEVTQEEFVEFLRSVIISFDFTMPGKVKQVAGPKTGISLSDNKLSIDMMALLLPIFEGKEVEAGTCEFVIEGLNVAVEEVVKAPAFTDVSEDAWYYEAVDAMSKQGIVNGMGDGLFAPEATMTYAQFCQLVAKQVGIEVGELNGYWAGKAISGCIEYGVVDSLGEVTPAIYDVPITREAAIAAMYRIVEAPVVKDVSAANIPDFAEIDAKFQADVLGAYQVGITSGMDEMGTFQPKNSLRRAEVCQLFYNVIG